MVNYYTERFPAVPMQEFANGLYAFNEDAREQWLEMEDFPLYEMAVEDGQHLGRLAAGDDQRAGESDGGLLAALESGEPCFHHTLGLPLEPLPASRHGAATGYRPDAAVPGVGWLPMIPEGRARGAEAEPLRWRWPPAPASSRR